MSFWAEDPELFLYKGKDGVVHVLRCRKETTTSSSSSMLMKPEDFTDEGAVTDLRSLTGDSYDWDRNKYEALIDYIYARNLLVNCHGSVVVELKRDKKNKKAAAVVYMRAVDILDMGCYGPGPDHPGRAVPVRTVKYLQDGTVVQTEPTPKEIKLSKEVDTLKEELLLAKEKIGAESAKEMKLSKEVDTYKQELLLAKEKTRAELAKAMKLTEELAIKSKEVETLQQLSKTTIEGLTKRVTELEIEMRTAILLPKARIYTKAATNCSLTIRNGRVILGSNNDMDDCQYWVKDDIYGGTVKDKWGFPSYALVNKFTGQALKPNKDSLELVPFNRNVIDKSILWTEQELADGYRTIRKATDPILNMDASADHGGIGDGNNVGLWTWWGGDNQQWRIISYS